MSQFETVGYDVKNRVATITLNRPDVMNSFNQQLRCELLAAIQLADQDKDVRIVILTGAGRCFSAGADIADGLVGYADIDAQIKAEYKPVLMAIRESEKLYISAVHGACVGIGSALAMTCDLTVMAEDAYIYQAFATLGLIPDGGASYHLVHNMGYKRAIALFAEAGKLNAEACSEYGLANRIVPAGSHLEAAQTWAEKLSEGSPLAQRWGKAVMQKALSMPLADVIDLESNIQVATTSSQDHRNAAMAFFKREKPVFNGT